MSNDAMRQALLALGPYFESWPHDSLVKFAKEAYDKLQKQEEELQRLRNPWPFPRRGNYPDDMPEAPF
jgi:hypothetical protein